MRIFVSYSRADTVEAEQIVASLKQAGHDVFFDRSGIQVSEDFNRVIWGEIRRADLFVFLISSNSTRPGSYALTELGLAEKKWPNPEKRVLSVLLEPLELSAIPVYASLCHLLQAEGNLVAEVRLAVNALGRAHRWRLLGLGTAAVAGLLIVGTLALLGYRTYLDQRPLAAREKLVAMDIYSEAGFIESAADGDARVVDLFLSAGMDPDAVGDGESYRGASALMVASRNGHREIVSSLLQAGADAGAEDRYGSSALAWAATGGQSDIVALLLTEGTNAESVNKAFVAAGSRGDEAVLRLLLEHEVWPSSIDKAFVEGAKRGDLAMLRFLLGRLDSGSNATSEGLVAASSNPRGSTEDTENGNRDELLKYLLDAGADINAMDEQGITPLTGAVSSDNKLAVRLLLREGAMVDQPCTCSGFYGGGWTPLTLAIKKGDTAGTESIIERLLAAGADVNVARKGVTPLMLAAENADAPLVDKLLGAGALVNATNEKGYTVLVYAASDNALFAGLLDQGAEVDVGSNPLIPFIAIDDLSAVERLLAAGADVNKPSGEGQTPLMVAAREAGADMVRRLLAAGARRDEQDELGRSAGTFALRRQHAEISRLLTGEAQ